jgi:transcription elongation GreA/GreB family factor
MWHLSGVPGASTFYQSTDITNLIANAEAVTPTLQPHGTYIRVIDAGSPVGIDRATGEPTSIYTVITEPNGDLISSYPGR